MGSDTHQALTQLLEKYLSPINAKSILSRALTSLQLRPDQLSQVHLQKLFERIEPSARLFIPASEIGAFQQAARELQGAPLTPMRRIPVLQERDITEVLLVVRELCRTAGAKTFTTQTMLTAVSELARNIVSYTPGGYIEVGLVAGTPPRLKVQAVDQGGGITNLPEVLSGRYRSKTGLGKGLLGVKQLAASFDIQTGPRGTTVTLEFKL